MSLNIDPSEAIFPATGGNGTFKIVNNTDARHAYKVKTSNNEHYRVNSVYGFVEAKATVDLEIMRLTGPPKKDKLVVLWAEVPDEETDPKAPFVAQAQSGEVILPLRAE